MAEHGLQAAVRQLLRALAEEDEAQQDRDSSEGAILFLALGSLSSATESRKERERDVRIHLGAEISRGAGGQFPAAVRLLLDAIADEDKKRQDCDGLDGASYFLALGPRNEATELRQGYVRLVSRLLDKEAVQGAGENKGAVAPSVEP